MNFKKIRDILRRQQLKTSIWTFIVTFSSEDPRPVEFLAVCLDNLILHKLDYITLNIDDNRLGTGHTSASTGHILNGYLRDLCLSSCLK